MNELYLYYEAGMRIYKQSGGIGVPSESFYLISAGGVMYSIEETRFHSNGNGNSTIERYNIPDLGYEDQHKEINYQIQDHLGNLRLSYTVLHCPSCSEQNCATVDVQYQINYIAEYLAYGGLLREFVRNGTAGEKFLSTGHERDKQTSWDYRQARYYDADLGRFLAVDPLGVFRIWLSPYNYCQNNPINRVDLTGALDWEPDGKGRLRAQAGDNEETLAQYLNIHEGQARRIFHDLKNWDGGTNLNGIKDVEGHILTIGVNLLHLSPTPTLRESYFYYDARPEKNKSFSFFSISGNNLPEWMAEANTTVGAFSAANGLKTELFEYAVRNRYKTARTWNEFQKLRPSQQNWRLNNSLTKTGASYLKYAKGLGIVAAGLNTTYSVANAGLYYYNGGTDWRVGLKSTLDIMMTGAAFFGPIGFGISATYFIIDASTGGFGGFGSTE